MIYFIFDELSNAVKIGKTKDEEVYTRLSMLQVGNPRELKLLGVVKGYTEEEKELHYKFREYAIRGEWFDYVAEIQLYLETNAIDYVRPKYTPRYNAVKNKERYIRQKNISTNMLEIYFTKDENSTMPVEKVKEYMVKNNIVGTNGRGTLPVTKVAEYFGASIQNKRLEGRNSKCTRCLVGVAFMQQ